MYIDKKMQELQEFFEVHFLYFNGVEMESVTDLNSSTNRFELSLSFKNYLRLLINDYPRFFKKVSRVFIYKYKNGKKTWSKVFNAQSDEFFEFINHRTKEERIQEQKELFEPTSEHLKKSFENFKKEDGYKDYCEVLKKLGKQ